MYFLIIIRIYIMCVTRVLSYTKKLEICNLNISLEENIY